jgi:hypothetical protein
LFPSIWSGVGLDPFLFACAHKSRVCGLGWDELADGNECADELIVGSTINAANGRFPLECAPSPVVLFGSSLCGWRSHGRWACAGFTTGVATMQGHPTVDPLFASAVLATCPCALREQTRLIVLVEILPYILPPFPLTRIVLCSRTLEPWQIEPGWNQGLDPCAFLVLPGDNRVDHGPSAEGISDDVACVVWLRGSRATSALGSAAHVTIARELRTLLGAPRTARSCGPASTWPRGKHSTPGNSRQSPFGGAPWAGVQALSCHAGHSGSTVYLTFNYLRDVILA